LKIPKGISKKNRQHNEQKRNYKRTNNDLQNTHIKLKIVVGNFVNFLKGKLNQYVSKFAVIANLVLAFFIVKKHDSRTS
jgi:hypothetical protein